MYKINIEDLQNIIKKPIEHNIKALGLDVATRTGWSAINVNSKVLTIDYGFIKVDTKSHTEKMNKYLEYFDEIIKPDYRLVIEDSFLKNNALTLKLLAKLEAVAYCVAKYKKIKQDPIFLFASTARKNLGINGICKKIDVHKWLQDKLKIELKDEDAVDAIVLAINGITKEKI